MSKRASVTFDNPKRDIRAQSVTFSPDRDNRDKGGVGGVYYDRKGVVSLSEISNVTGECHAQVSRSGCHGVTRDSDKPSSPSGRARHGHETRQSAGKEKTSWMHLAAMNLVHDHEAGVKVDASKLELAKRLLGLPYAPARISAEEA